MTATQILEKWKDGNVRLREGRNIQRGTRIAGNIENPDILGSRSSPRRSPPPSWCWGMGHSACGAVAGAIADAKPGNLTQVLAKIRPALRATTYHGQTSRRTAR